MNSSATKSLDSEVSIQPLAEMSLSNADELTQLQQQKRIGFVLLKAGTGQLWVDDHEYTMENNIMYCIPAGHWHKFSFSVSSEGFLMLLPEAFLHLGNDNVSLHCRAAIFDLFKRQPALRIGREGAILMEQIISKMSEKKTKGRLFQAELVRAYGGIFLVQLARQMTSFPNAGSQKKDIELAERFIALVGTKYLVWRKVTDYATALGITPNYLNAIVKRVSGDTVSGHIRDRIVLAAKRKVIHDHSSMKEISYYLGFKDIAHFSKFFKAVYGKNFSDFKREA